MKAFRFFLVCLLAFSSQALAFNSQGLKSLIQQYEAGKYKVGVHVYSLKQNKELFAYNANELMNPASNTKVLSSATAFARLGPNFRFETKFLTDLPLNNGAIGNIYIVGGGDPQLTEDKVAEIADELYAVGVRLIKGDIVVDQTFFDKKGFGESMANEGTYKAPLNALVVNFSRFGVVVSPGKSKPEVKIDFPSDYFTIRNNLRIGKGGISVTKKFEVGHELIDVKGAFRGKSDQIIYRDVSSPSLFAGYFFKSFFEKRGIKVMGHAHEGTAPETAQHLLTHNSDKIEDIIKVMNKKSINFTAEMITKFLGAKYEGAPGSTAKGVKVIGDYLKALSISQSDFVLENGSGLSRLTRITPSVLTRVFRDIKAHNEYSQEYLDTLAVAGEDGTVKRRFRDSDLKGHAFLKTGTLNGVSSLAGFVEAPSGDNIVFSILINGSGLNAWKAHEFQEDILEYIIH